MRKSLLHIAVLGAFGLASVQAQAADLSEEEFDREIPAAAAENAASDPDFDMEEDMNHDPIDVEDFVETVSAKGVAEIEMARMALDEGTQNIHEFANRMIQDHTKANKELREIAQQQDLELSDDPNLMDKAKAMMLSIRDDESFDEAYLKNQIHAHEDTIKLFERASHSDNAAIKSFAREKLPTLREHLQMAEKLHEQYEN